MADSSAPKTAQSNGNSQAVRSLIAGVGAGVICTFICAPLDLTKVRMQVEGTLSRQGKSYTQGVLSYVKKIYIEEGLKGVFKGVGPALVTVPFFWGVYWPVYGGVKDYLSEKHSLSTPVVNLCAAVSAGAIGDVLTNPFWVVRTRIQTLALHPEAHLSPDISTLQMMQTIYSTEGWHAFYKGLGASFLGLSHVAIQFPLCEFMFVF
jgi:solute carrier family 25 (mitochondrial folate transporter), member 32